MCRYLRVHDALLLFPLTHPGCSAVVQADMAFPVARVRVCSSQGGWGRNVPGHAAQCAEGTWQLPTRHGSAGRACPPLPTRLLLPFASFSLCADRRDRRDWATDNANALLFTMNHPEGQPEKAEFSAGGAGPGWKTKRQGSSGCWGEAVATESLAQEHTPTKEPSFITRGGSE